MANDGFPEFLFVLVQPKLSVSSSVFVCVCLGGQRLLAVDIPGPSAAEEQQGPLLSAPVETSTSHAARRRGD